MTTKKERINKHVTVIKLQDKPSVPLIVTNPLVGSGALMRMSELGTLQVVSPLVLKHQKIGEHLALVEAKLIACNDFRAMELAQYCERRQKHFPTELKNVAKQLETEKARLRKELQTIEKRLRRQNPALAELVTGRVYALQSPITLIPSRPVESNPDIMARDKFIAKHRTLSDRDICKRLDLEFAARSGEPTRTLPDTWVENYGLKTFCEAYKDKECRCLVQSLIAKAKKRYSTYPRV
jgi:hypothetical protein